MPYLKIVLQSDLCAGSGSSNGNAVDTDTCIDATGLPIIPARRLKGVLRETAELLCSLAPEEYSPAFCQAMFGQSAAQEGLFYLQDAQIVSAQFIKQKIAQNKATAQNNTVLKDLLHPANISNLFTNVRGQTAITADTGVATEGSLRFTRVINHYAPGTQEEQVFYAPCYLPEGYYDCFAKVCKAVRHIGLHRNRGLGVVSCTLSKKLPNQTADTTLPEQIKTAQAVIAQQTALDATTPLKISYTLRLDAPLTLPEGETLNTAVPASSVIGCLAGAYLKTQPDHKADEVFHRLFTTGKTAFSALTPVISGRTSDPTPLHLVHLKNLNRYANRFTPAFEQVKHQKQKTLDGTYAITTENGYRLGMASTQTVYHHAKKKGDTKGTLYTQKSLCAGQVYGGSVTVCAALAQTALALLHTAPLRFGRSRTAQYGACSLASITAEPYTLTRTPVVAATETCYVVLKSDLLLCQNGLYTVQNSTVRHAIAEQLGVSAEKWPDANGQIENDWCIYRKVSGFQASWGLHKYEHEVLGAGSVLCFKGNDATLPREFVIGERQQEGFGVCHVYTQEEMNYLSDVQKGAVDSTLQLAEQTDAPQTTYAAQNAAANIWYHIQTALYLAKIKEKLAQRASDIAKTNKLGDLATASFLGRLRLMLLESNGDVQRFMAQINSIANEHKKHSALHLCETLWGGESICTQTMLADDALLQELNTQLGEQQTAALLANSWAILAEQTLTFIKYQKRTQNQSKTESATKREVLP